MMNRTIKDIQKDIELLGINGGYNVEQLLTPQDCRRLSYKIDELEKENQRLKDDKKKVLELIENDYFEDGSFENYYEVLKILKGEE